MRRLYAVGAVAGLDLADDTDRVRVLDVALVGPAMIFAAIWPAALPALLRGALLVSGAATIAYNWRRMGRA